MQLATYFKEALQTESIVSKSVPFATDTRHLHATIGFITETGELFDALKRQVFYKKPFDKINFVEELGDITWYLAVWCAYAQVSAYDVRYGNGSVFAHTLQRATLEDGLLFAQREYASLLEKLCTVQPDSLVNAAIAMQAFDFVNSMRQKWVPQCSLEQVFAINILKLRKKRFKNGTFDLNDVLNRDLVAEREALEAAFCQINIA